MRTDYIEPRDMERIVARLTPQNALVMRLCMETGLRVGDAVALPFEALHGNYIHYVAQKTKKRGKAKISSKLFHAILRNTDGVFCFPSKKSGSGHLSRQTVWHNVKRVATELGITLNVAPHSARKIFAVEHMKTDGIAAVQRELQHGDMATTLLYCLSDKRLFGSNDNIIGKLCDIERKLDRLERAFEKALHEAKIAEI